MNSNRLIVITGPECSGKTALAEQMSKAKNTVMVPEVARTYLENQNNQYNFEDLKKIAELQFSAIEKAIKTPNINVVCDTDLLTIIIWSIEKFGKVDSSIESLFNKQAKGKYLLCKPSLPWVFDPQRENPNDRDRLLSVYETQLKQRQLAYELVDVKLLLSLD